MINNVKTSLYCWIALSVFIGGTLIFMVNFYNHAVTKITANYQSHQLITTYNLKDYAQQ